MTENSTAQPAYPEPAKIVFTVYDPRDGKVLRSGECLQANLGNQAKASESLIAGESRVVGTRIIFLADPPIRVQLAELSARLDRLEQTLKLAGQKA